MKSIPVTNVHFRVVDQAATAMADPHEYNMSGVKVKFPHKAYPSQVGKNFTASFITKPV